MAKSELGAGGRCMVDSSEVFTTQGAKGRKGVGIGGIGREIARFCRVRGVAEVSPAEIVGLLVGGAVIELDNGWQLTTARIADPNPAREGGAS